MAKKSKVLTRILLFFAALIAAVTVYCVDIASTAVYANESSLAVHAALERQSADPLSEPEVAPLAEILKRDKGELAIQSVQSLLDLRASVEQGLLKEVSDRLQSTKAKMTFGVNEVTLTSWRILADEALKTAAETDSEDAKRQTITTLRQEVNKAIVSSLVPRPPQSTLNQYLYIKNYIPALPELTELISNKEITTD